MNEDRTIWWWAAGVGLATLAAGGWWWWSGRVPPPEAIAEAPQPTVAPTEPATTEPAVPEHPIEAAPAALAAAGAESLPPLAESDSVLRSALSGLVGEQALLQFFQMTGLATRFVATVDNLPRSKLSTQVMPLRGPGGVLAVDGGIGELSIGAANPGRYSGQLLLLDSIDMRKAALLYVRFYPLLAQAYRDLGYPEGQFNDRMVAVIDHLLATPRIDAPIGIVQPKVLYEFADAELEARSAGQKLLLRMGPENAQRVKAKLREFRAEITASPPPLQ